VSGDAWVSGDAQVDGRVLLVLAGASYRVTISNDGYMSIGGENHTLLDWEKHGSQIAAKHHGTVWWEQWGETVLDLARKAAEITMERKGT